MYYTEAVIHMPGNHGAINSSRGLLTTGTKYFPKQEIGKHEGKVGFWKENNLGTPFCFK